MGEVEDELRARILQSYASKRSYKEYKDAHSYF